jgi:hypothetical protein
MPKNTKIATCCYCGTRAALVLTGKERHELSCAGCGAPLHDLKSLRPVAERQGSRELVRPSRPRRTLPDNPPPSKKRDKKRRKRRKPLMKKVFSEAFDLIEDIFD